MQALRWHGRRDVRVDDVAEPPAEAGDALVEVALCGICGTDLSEWLEGPLIVAPDRPVILGHELSGVVREGPLPAGTRVVVDPRIRCGACPECARGEFNLCRRGRGVGLHTDGGFAPLLGVPGYTLVEIPDGVSDAHAALSEPLAVGLHGLERGGLRDGASVVVLGFGPIGACSAVVARALGAPPVVVERDEGRRAAASALGFETLDAGDDLLRRVKRRLDGGAQLVVESTGAAALVGEAIAMTARGGAVALLGLPKVPAEIDVRALVIAERSLVGSFGYLDDQARVLDMIAAGRLDVGGLVSETVALSNAPAAFADLATAPGGRLKVLVDPSR